MLNFSKFLWMIVCATAIFFPNHLFAQDPQTAPKGKFSGYMFGDYFYNIQQKDTSRKDLNGFQFRRIYLTYDYAIAPNFDTRFRLEDDQAELFSNNKFGVFVKDAYLKWKEVFQGSTLVFGLSPTPAYDVSEESWGYRSLEKTIMDLRGIVPSRDLGIDLKGKLTSDGTINYWMKIGNNSGNTPESDKFKRYYAQLHFKPAANLQVIASADYDAEAKITDTYDQQTKENTRIVVSGFINYKETDNYSLGIEGFYKTAQNNFRPSSSTALENQHTYGVTFFAWGTVADNVRLVGRFDMYDPNSSVDNDGNYLFIGAVDYLPAPDVHIMPNFYYQSYQATSAQSDIVARMTLFYIFK
jgi:hypothetical protein